jgi:hypothetical protein
VWILEKSASSQKEIVQETHLQWRNDYGKWTWGFSPFLVYPLQKHTDDRMSIHLLSIGIG